MMMVQTNKYKFNNIVSWVMIVCMISTLLLLLYWMFYPFHVMDICETKIKTPRVKPGQYLVYDLKYKKFIDVPGDIDRRLINHVSIPLVSHEGFRRSMGEQKTEIHVWIPRLTPPGIYKLHTTITYDINPLRKTMVSYDTPEFEVIDGK